MGVWVSVFNSLGYRPEVELLTHGYPMFNFFFLKKPLSWCFYFTTTKNYPPPRMMLTVAWLFPPYSEQKGHSKKGCSLVLCQATHMPLWKAWLLFMDLFINSTNVDWYHLCVRSPTTFQGDNRKLDTISDSRAYSLVGRQASVVQRPRAILRAQTWRQCLSPQRWRLWAGPDPGVPSLPWVSALSSVKWRWPVSPLPTSLMWQHGTPFLSFSFIF